MSYRQLVVRISLGLLITVLLVTGCSKKDEQQPAADSEQSTQEVVVAAAEASEVPTEAPTDSPTAEPTVEVTKEVTEAEQPESPLAGEQPVSPLAAPQPQSPLEAPAAATGFNTTEPIAIEVDVKDGQALVVGVLVSQITGQPLKNTVVRFPEVNCPEAEQSDDADQGKSAGDGCFWTLSDAFTPGTVTLDDGSFEVEVEEPGEYMFLVGDMMTVYTFGMVDEDNAYRFIAPIDTAIDLGQMFVDYQ